ncbi:MAG: hypothetical protein IMF10_00550 [Proteobacteria bacterium]|nr:hypothetical protein [Pseudomonadota bacterium]
MVQLIAIKEAILMDFSIFSHLRRFFSGFHAMHRESAAALTIVEMEELENIFALLLLGSFVGFPSPPTFLAVELLPFMEKELKILNRRAKDADDMLAEMCGTIGID